MHNTLISASLRALFSRDHQWWSIRGSDLGVCGSDSGRLRRWRSSGFCIPHRTASSPAKELVIPYQIFGTATPNIDYALPEGSSIQDGLVQGVVVLQPDENAVSLTLPTLVDGFVDAGESIQVWLQPPTDDSYNILWWSTCRADSRCRTNGGCGWYPHTTKFRRWNQQLPQH